MSRAAGMQSTVYSSTRQPRPALPLLDEARKGAEPGLWRVWIELETAIHHADLGDRRAVHHALETAYHHYPRGDGFGYLSRGGYFSGFDGYYLAGWSGRVLGQLGVTDEALHELGTALAAPSQRPRATARCYVDATQAYAVAGEVEMACDAAGTALDGCHQTGYGLGVERIRQLHASFLADSANLGCVRELGERLRLA